jgi:hypothetical protein
METLLEAQAIVGVTLEVVEVLYDMGELLLVLFSDRVLA